MESRIERLCAEHGLTVAGLPRTAAVAAPATASRGGRNLIGRGQWRLVPAREVAVPPS